MLFVFDLDGTLADTSINIAYAANYTLRQIGLAELPTETIVSFVGSGSKTLIARCLEHQDSYDEQLYQQALDVLFPYYFAHAEEHTQLYPGVEETLNELACAKTVLTNKPSPPAQRLLQHFGLDHHFAEIIGGDEIEYLKPDPRKLQGMIASQQVEPQRVYMVGDSAIDVEVAKNAGVHSVAVTYGFGNPEELRGAKADIYIDNFCDILEVFLNQ